MTLISGTQLGKEYGPQHIFSGVDVSIARGARVALVGPNGAGKTTLLRILCGLEEPSHGVVRQAKGIRLGYLPQDAAVLLSGTVWDQMLTAFAPLREMEAELARLGAVMSDPGRSPQIVERYGELQIRFEHAGGYTYEATIRQVLGGLGFSPADYDKPIEILSGGQKTRTLLARLLLENPDLLILDEPTNHLDLQAVEWLESWLSEWPGAVLIVSHDRYFLDRLVTTVWELCGGHLTEYRGNYSACLRQRAERQARQAAADQARREFIERETDYIRRNIAGRNSRQAQGRRRRLERLLAADTDDGGMRPHKERQLKFRLEAESRSGDLVLETDSLQVGYAAGQVLFETPPLLLRRGECVALIGPNGAGKTTFLKTLLGEVPPLAGHIRLGSALKVGYFAQTQQDLLCSDRTVLEEVCAAGGLEAAGARHYLAGFLFTGDDVFKPMAALSGGERARLALAKLALQGANLLLLDEPTNHLDIPSQEVLQAVLADFQGTILLVSHDRYLIDALATQIWALLDGRLEVFQGNWSEYTAWRAENAARQAGSDVGTVKRRPSPAAAAAKAEQRQQKIEARRRAARLTEVETSIEALEQQLAELTRQLENAGTDVERVRRLGEEYARVSAELETRLNEWGELAL